MFLVTQSVSCVSLFLKYISPCVNLRGYIDDIAMLGKCSIKWRQRHDMTIAVDWDAKPQINQSINQSIKQSISPANTTWNNGMSITIDFYFNDFKT